MKNRRSLNLIPILLSLTALLPHIAVGQAPVVRKVEPPNWWVSFTPELTLLLTGEHLSDAKAESQTAELDVVSSEASANGHYLFVHLKLSPTIQPGAAHLRLRSPSGSTELEFPMLARPVSRGGFEGVSQDDVIYLIMPDRFADGDPSNDRPPGSTGVCDRTNPMAYHGGDLRGVRDRLQYLHDLGVTTIWLTPVWKNADSDYHGYHVIDFYALDDHMGSMQEYQNLVAEAQQLGMKVLIDYVANHTGPKHPWASDPPTPTWFHGSPAHHLPPSYSFLGLVDPHAPAREYKATLDGWFAGKLPDLNPDDPQLGLYLAQNALWWVETAQLDGFRLDTFPYSSRQFWSGWQQSVSQVFPHINSIGEVSDPDSTITSFFEGGRSQFDGVDSRLATVFDFPLEDALREVVIKGAPMQKIIDILRHDSLYPHPEMLVTFLGNHDNERFVSVAGSDSSKLKAAFSLLLTTRGIPQLYAGDEIGMPGGGDPDNRRDFPGGFPDDPRNALTSAGRTSGQQDIFAHVQSLLALRQSHPALRHGKQWHIGWDDTYYAFLRQSPEEKLLVVYNNSGVARDLRIPIDDTPLQGVEKLDSLFGTASASVSKNEVRVTVPSRTAVIFTAH